MGPQRRSGLRSGSRTSPRPITALKTYPILRVADADAFAPKRPLDFLQPFTAQHWDVVEALVRDPDGRTVSLQAPLPKGVSAPDADAHHEHKYGSS
jgi:hypothetical protein